MEGKIMKKIWKQSGKKLVCGILAAAVAFTASGADGIGSFTPKKAEASVKIIYDKFAGKESTAEVDLDGDGKNETVEISLSGTEESCKAVVKVNDEIALESEELFDCYDATASYIKLSSKKIFLGLCVTGPNDDPQIDNIYRYDTKTGKLVSVLTLDSVAWKKGANHIYASVGTKDGKLKVKYSGQIVAAGFVTFTYQYQYKNGKFVRTSDTATVTPKLHKATFKAKKKLTFYKKPGSKVKAFTIKSGKSVTIKKVKIYKNAYYLQFKYGKKTGWIYGDKYDIFEDVQLAG